MLRCTLLDSVFCNIVKITLIIFILAPMYSFSNEFESEKNQLDINEALKSVSKVMKSEKANKNKFALDSALNSTNVKKEEVHSQVLPDVENFGNYTNAMNGAIEPLMGNIMKSQKHSEGVNRFGFSSDEMASLRVKTLEAFGIDRGVQGFIFVSRSMQDSLLRSYSLQAEKYGFQMIFKGPEKNSTDIMGTMREWGELFHTKSSLMAIQMDPRLFDSFEVKAVPTIILTQQGSLDLCQDGPIENVTYGLKTLKLNKCAPVEDEFYCKISGPVSLDWAIKYMSSEGCVHASNFIDMVGASPEMENFRISPDSWLKAVNKLEPSKSSNRYNEIVMDQLTEDYFK